ncbi:MAG: Gldg family protein, partial [Deltaproteobacteria bacterium]|nr:Gldg family protein [Deltaproteobacteria bacterium]
MTSRHKKRSTRFASCRDPRNTPWSFAFAEGVRCAAVACACVVSLALAATPAGSEQAPTAAADASSQVDRCSVGFVAGHGKPTLDGQLSGVAEHLRETCDVAEVRLSDGAAVLDVFDVVVVVGEQDIPDAELYELDQFLMRGGRLAFLLDAATIPPEGTQANISESNVFGFLGTYGVVVNPDLVLDNSCAGGAVWGSIETQ